jgi:hypothetical protein
VLSCPIEVRSTGNDVRRVQRASMRWRTYYALTGHPPMVLPAVDGVFAPVIEAALRVFQTS